MKERNEKPKNDKPKRKRRDEEDHEAEEDSEDEEARPLQQPQKEEAEIAEGPELAACHDAGSVRTHDAVEPSRAHPKPDKPRESGGL